MIVYSTPNCMKCSMTKARLDARGIPYQSVDLSQDIQAMDFVRGLGYQSAPVVYVDESTHWDDFRYDRIMNL